MSEAQTLAQGAPGGTPIIDIIRRRGLFVPAPPQQGATETQRTGLLSSPVILTKVQQLTGGKLGPVSSRIYLIRSPQAPPGGPVGVPGQAQLTGSQDFLIGLGVGALAVIVVGALTFEVWAPKVAARIARSAGKGLIGGLGGTAGKGLLGFGIVNLGAMGGGAGRGQILSAGAGGRGIIDKIPRPLKGLYRP